MDCSTPGLPVHRQLLEFTQTHVHRVGDAIQPSHSLSSPSAFNLSQHQGLFKCVSSLHQVAKVLGVSALASVLPTNNQDWFPLGWTGWILQSKGLSKVFSNTTVQKHQFLGDVYNSCIYLYMTTGKTIALTRWTFVGKVTSLLFNILSRFIITFFPRSKHLYSHTNVHKTSIEKWS